MCGHLRVLLWPVLTVDNVTRWFQCNLKHYARRRCFRARVATEFEDKKMRFEILGKFSISLITKEKISYRSFRSLCFSWFSVLSLFQPTSPSLLLHRSKTRRHPESHRLCTNEITIDGQINDDGLNASWAKCFLFITQSPESFVFRSRSIGLPPNSSSSICASSNSFLASHLKTQINRSVGQSWLRQRMDFTK